MAYTSCRIIGTYTTWKGSMAIATPMYWILSWCMVPKITKIHQKLGSGDRLASPSDDPDDHYGVPSRWGGLQSLTTLDEAFDATLLDSMMLDCGPNVGGDGGGVFVLTTEPFGPNGTTLKVLFIFIFYYFCKGAEHDYHVWESRIWMAIWNLGLLLVVVVGCGGCCWLWLWLLVLLVVLLLVVVLLLLLLLVVAQFRNIQVSILQFYTQIFVALLSTQIYSG